MKTILLFRHGKSDWAAPHESDHERILAKRGIKAARRMGAWLSETNQIPEYLVSSTAVRALTTLELAREAGGWKPEIHTTSRLYEATVQAYIDVIRETPDDAGSVLIAGHEPTCSMTTSRLIGGGHVRFPTAAMARIDVGIESWNQLSPGAGVLVWFVPPRFMKSN